VCLLVFPGCPSNPSGEEHRGGGPKFAPMLEKHQGLSASDRLDGIMKVISMGGATDAYAGRTDKG